MNRIDRTYLYKAVRCLELMGMAYVCVQRATSSSWLQCRRRLQIGFLNYCVYTRHGNCHSEITKLRLPGDDGISFMGHGDGC